MSGDSGKRLATGVIGGPHGIHGELKVRSFSGETEHFSKLTHVTLRKADAPRELEFEVERVRGHGEKILLKLVGIDTPEAARRFNGFEIWVQRNEAAPCAEDEYYIADLVGLVLVYQGREVATVRSVWENGATAMLDVETRERKSAVVPFREPFVGEVMLEAGGIELLTDWILE